MPNSSKRKAFEIEQIPSCRLWSQLSLLLDAQTYLHQARPAATGSPASTAPTRTEKPCAARSHAACVVGLNVARPPAGTRRAAPTVSWSRASPTAPSSPRPRALSRPV